MFVAQVNGGTERDESAHVLRLVCDHCEMQCRLRVLVAHVQPLVVVEARENFVEQLLVFGVNREMQNTATREKRI